MDNLTFWNGAARGELMLKRCVDTGRCFHYPREHSPFTGGRTEWVKASGTGEIYSCSIAYRANPAYCIAYIRLAEGPIVMSRVESADLSSIAIGQQVRVQFRKDAANISIPYFVRAE